MCPECSWDNQALCGTILRIDTKTITPKQQYFARETVIETGPALDGKCWFRKKKKNTQVHTLPKGFIYMISDCLRPSILVPS